MPAEGVTLSPQSHLLSTNEVIHIAKLFVNQGITKIRLTGGEPTIRKDLPDIVSKFTVESYKYVGVHSIE